MNAKGGIDKQNGSRKICYTDNMQIRRGYWSHWVDLLKRWELANLAAWLLEAGGPLTLLSAQALYFGRPLFSSNTQIVALAQLLEDRNEAQAFLTLLQEEVTS